MAIINAGGGRGLEPLIEVLLNEKQLAQEKERINLTKKDQELRAQQAASEQQRVQDAITGASAAAQLFAARDPRIAAAMQGMRPGATPAFMESLQAFESSQAQTGRTTAETDLTQTQTSFNVATERARIMQEFAQARGMSLQNAIAEVTVKNGDVPRFNSAFNMMSTGELTWGQVSGSLGLPLGSIPEDFKLNPLAASGSGGESAIKASSLYNIMTASNTTMNELVDSGVRLGLFESWHRSSTNWLTSWVSGVFTDDKQRQLIQSQKQFADSYRFFISGQQSSDKEAERLLFTVLENPGDNTETIRQKRFMRSLTIQMAQQVAQGQVDPVRAAQNILDAATRQGMPEDILNVFREQVSDAAAYSERGGPFGGGLVPATSGGNIGNVPGLIDLGLN